MAGVRRKFRRFRKRGGKARRKNRKLATIGSVKRLIGKNQELKVFHADPLTLTSIYGVVSVSDLTLISEGTADGERVGDRILLKGASIHWSIQLQENLASTSTDFVPYIYRVALFTWKPEANVVAVAGQNVLGGVLHAWSHDNRQQYKVIYDSGPRTMTWNVDRNCAAGHIRAFLKNQIQYQGGDENFGTYKVYLWMSCQIADSRVGTVPVDVLANCNAQMTYTDG